MKRIYTLLLTMFFAGYLFAQGGDLLVTNTSVHVNGIICLQGGYIDQSNGQLEINGELCFVNKDEIELVLSSGSALENAILNFKGNANTYLEVNDVSVKSLIVNITNGDLHQSGNLEITDNLQLFKGRVITDENGVLTVLNTSDHAIVFNNSQGNTSYVIGNLVRTIDQDKSYAFPVGDESSFHPLELSEFKESNKIQVNYDSDLDDKWNDANANSPMVFPGSGGWTVKAEQANASYEAIVSLLDKEGNLLEGKYALMYAKEDPFYQSKPIIDRDAEMKEPFYLAGYVPVQEGILAVIESRFGYLADKKELELVNTIVIDERSESYFIIPGMEDFQNINLKVYNSLGGLIFSSEDYQNNLNFRDYNDGTYYYYLKATMKDGSKLNKSNYVEIVRSNE
ncbi:gliding motility-associated C-terminal domain-containing protein [Ancylomarina sp. DW003]|nr:gliding motility-associated C-terminal domain-containing protein [Ancylomarina sp. DW003]MDE5421156.1 gliding motility-associated C-terminal domain-containing protein [Ancylomarina sp. DW003]